MAITASEKGERKDFKKVPPGCHFAICNMVVDLGVQETSFQGQSKQQHKVYLRWETPDERVTYERDGKEVEGPCSIGATYTLSLSPKANLRKILENWRGQAFTAEELKGFDITKLAGKACQIVVTHQAGADGTIYANVSGVMAISKDQRGRKDTKSEIGVLVYQLDAPDDDVFEMLPKWLKEKLQSRIAAPVLTAVPEKPVVDPELDDEVPF